METYTLNIGLTNNPFSFIDLENYLHEVVRNTTKFQFGEAKRVMGEYNDLPEDTMVVEVNTTLPLSAFINTIEILCTRLTQDCIAVRSNHFEALVYNTSYSGDKFKFDNQYFKI